MVLKRLIPWWQWWSLVFGQSLFRSPLLRTRSLSCSPRRQCTSILDRRQIQVDVIVWVVRWSWKGHTLMTLGKPQLCTLIAQVSWETELQAVLPEDSVSHWYNSFNGKIVLVRLRVSDTGEAAILHVHWSGLRETTASSHFPRDRTFSHSAGRQSFKLIH